MQFMYLNYYTKNINNNKKLDKISITNDEVLS
jgi:hypothetical protein